MSLPATSKELKVYLKEFKRNQPDEKLPISVSSTLVLAFKQQLHVNPHESVAALSALVHFIPASDENQALFNDKDFLKNLLRYSIRHPLDNAPFNIVITFLRGDFFTEQTTIHNNNNDSYRLFLSILYKNKQFLANVIPRFNLKDQNTCIITIQFLASLYIVMTYKCNAEYTLASLILLREVDMPRVIRHLIYKYNVLPVANFMSKFAEMSHTIYLCFQLIATTKYTIDNSPTYNKLLSDICASTKTLAYFKIKGLTEQQIFEKMDFTSNPKLYLSKRYHVLVLITINVFLKNPESREFKINCEKQHCLVGNFANGYPIWKFVFELANFLEYKFFTISNPNFSAISKFKIYTDELLLTLLNKSLIYWLNSGATNDNPDDLGFIINLLKIDLQYLNLNLTTIKEFGKASERLVTELSYDKIRKIQLRFLKDDQYLDFMNFKDLQTYNEVLIHSLKVFFINEKLMELNKGMACFTQNPTEFSSRQRSKAAPKIFIALSPNRNYIMYKEIPVNVDVKSITNDIIENSDDCKKIFIHSIKKVTADKILTQKPLGYDRNFTFSRDRYRSLQVAASGNQKFAAANKVFISSKNVITQIKLIGKSNNEILLSFYTETERSATLWLDTINLLTNRLQFSGVTEETKAHMEQLFDIKKSLQLVPLSSIYNNIIIDLYTTHNSSTGEPKADGEAATTKNFLEISGVDFEDTEDNSKRFKKFLSLLNNSGPTSQKQYDVSKDSNSSIAGSVSSEMEYSYDELVLVASDFYYS